MPETRIYCQTLALSAFVIGVLLACSLYLTNGQFVYAIDDAYIHLALASHLPGHYGTTAGIPAAASSSLIYPWLLMPFASFVWAPLLINLLALAVSLWLLCRISAQLGLYNFYPVKATAPVIVLFALATNLYILPFIGMEHGLHVTTVLAVLSGLIDLNENKPLPRWFWLALILMPMIRYEGFALFGLSLLWLLTTRYRSAAFMIGIVETAIQLAHAVYLHSLGLPVVAASILIKTGVNNSESSFGSIFERVIINLIHPQAQSLIIILVFLLISLRKHAQRMTVLVILTILAHILGGSIGWGGRYHAYLLSFSFIALIYVLRPAILAIRFTPAARILWALLLIGCFHTSFLTTFKTARFSQDIYLQQMQITHLVRQYWQGPVGANDIGYLSWQSPYSIYDIYGLGSEEVRRIRSHGDKWNPADMDDFAKRHGIGLFIIYNHWFEKQIPANWRYVAQLNFNRNPTIVAFNHVEIYLADPAQADRLQTALGLWEKTLPTGATLVRHQSE